MKYIIPGPFNTAYEISGSKSWTNRLLIAGAMTAKPFKIENYSKSKDSRELVRCLREVGVKIEEGPNFLLVVNTFPDCEVKRGGVLELDSGEGGTTNRFLLAFLALGKNKYRLKGGPQISSRPIMPLIESLRFLGAKIETGAESNFPIEIAGPIRSEKRVVKIDGSDSSQFASALQLLNASRELLQIDLENMVSSRSYYEMTKKAIEIVATGNSFIVPADWSSASYPLVATSQGQRFLFKNLERADSYQPDSSLLDILEDLGFEIEIEPDGFIVIPPESYDGKNLNCSGFLDLVPALVFLFAHAKSESELSGLLNLCVKESNRLDEIVKILELGGIGHRVNRKEGILMLEGACDSVKKFTYRSPGDHRMVMLAYLFMKAHNGGVLEDDESVEKSFPDFFEVMG